MTEVIPEVSAAVAETTAMKAPANGSAPADASKGAESDEQNSVLGLAVLFGLLGWLWIAAGWEFVVVVLTLVFMITMHELGHYLAARRGGMKVTEFFSRLRPQTVVVPARRDRVRRQGHLGRCLRQGHRHEQPRRG